MAVTVCDIALESPKRIWRRQFSSAAPCLVVVCEDDFNFLTKMCLSRNRELAFWTAKLARAHGCPAAVHGSDATDRIEEYLQAGFDYVLIGEVEETLLELATGKPPEQVTGLGVSGSQTTGKTTPHAAAHAAHATWTSFRCPRGI